MTEEQIKKHLSEFEKEFLRAHDSLNDSVEEERKILQRLASVQEDYKNWKLRARERQEQYNLFRLRHAQISGGRTINDIISEDKAIKAQEKARKKRSECSYCHDRSVHRIEDICSHCGNGVPYGGFK